MVHYFGNYSKTNKSLCKMNQITEYLLCKLEIHKKNETEQGEVVKGNVCIYEITLFQICNFVRLVFLIPSLS